MSDNRDVLVLFSGGKDSTYTALSLLKSYDSVYLLSFNNGALAGEKNLLWGAGELRKYSGDRVKYCGIYGTSACIKRLSEELYTLSMQDMQSLMPDVTYTQIRCTMCQTAMWVAAIAYARAKGIDTIACGYKQSDMFITGFPDYIRYIRKIAGQFGLSVELPMWAHEGNVNLGDFGIEDRVYEPQCKVGTPSGDVRLTTQHEQLTTYIRVTLTGRIISIIEEYTGMFRSLQLTTSAYK